MRLSSAGFERLVVKLLLSMGYGNGINDAGKVTRLSNDEGIDGITLTCLMIKRNVGVSTEHIYEIKRVDSDFFSEEL